MTIKGLVPVTENLIFIDLLSGSSVQVLRGFGFRLGVTAVATGNDIWPGTAVILPIPPDVGEQMQVVSTSASDTAAGTGVRTLAIHYIDALGNQKEENITMNGVTPVGTVATNIRFVQELHTLTTGSNLLSVGTITISTFGAPASIYTQIQPQTNQSLNTARMVPAGMLLLITAFHASNGSSAGAQSMDIRLRSTNHVGLLTPRLFHFIDNFMSFNSSSDRNYTQPIIVPSLGIVKCTAYANGGGSDVQSSWEGVLLPNPT